VSLAGISRVVRIVVLGGIMAETQAFRSLAEEFDLLALAFGESANSQQRADLLIRMKALIDELDERVIQEALLPAAPFR
jgi:hypothetical protein